jgi:hypothetical protein
MEIFDSLVQLQWQEISTYSELVNKHLADCEKLKRNLNDETKNNKEKSDKLNKQQEEDFTEIMTLRERLDKLEENKMDTDKNN